MGRAHQGGAADGSGGGSAMADETVAQIVEAGGTAAISQWNSFWMPGVAPTHIEVNDTGTGLLYGATPLGDEVEEVDGEDRVEARVAERQVGGVGDASFHS